MTVRTCCERSNLGDPPYGHLTVGLLRERMDFLLTEKSFLFAPVLLVAPAVVWLRSWVGLAGLVAALPWSLFMITALAPHVGAFETYYTFPLAAFLVWPLFVQPTRSWLLPAALVGCSLVMAALTFLPKALEAGREANLTRFQRPTSTTSPTTRRRTGLPNRSEMR